MPLLPEGRITVASACLAVAVCGAGGVWAQTGLSPEGPAVVATVGGEPIDADEVQRWLKRVAKDRQIAPIALPTMRAGVLAEIINQRLILAYARRTNTAAAEEEIDRGIARLRASLTVQGRSMDDYLREQSLTPPGLRRQIALGLTMPNYVARYATAERMQSYFAAHRRDFDGTEVSVSHILLRIEPGSAPKVVDALVQRAEAIRREITSGTVSFADAAKKYSTAPSAAQGGPLGWIDRHGAMVEAFARAAFKLQVQQISPPVVSPFGVHLIRCDAIRPGEKKLDQVAGEVREALSRELVEKLVRYERQYAPVEFTGAGAYFKPGTRELVLPGGSNDDPGVGGVSDGD